jgi:hypothetical protein
VLHSVREPRALRKRNLREFIPQAKLAERINYLGPLGEYGAAGLPAPPPMELL